MKQYRLMETVNKFLSYRTIKTDPNTNVDGPFYSTAFGVKVMDANQSSGYFTWKTLTRSIMTEMEVEAKYLERIEQLEAKNATLSAELDQLKKDLEPMKAFFDAKMHWDTIQSEMK